MTFWMGNRNLLYAFVSFRYDEELVIPIVENENEELEIKVIKVYVTKLFLVISSDSRFILCAGIRKISTLTLHLQ